ncbi:hypothetical protein AZE42_11083 [Rhizopogon vesiculosus]|uniref:Uncharacterized protein n=1 Tax=Rhizopogon vesiculosus TaxID=180088 RepID=A0A1J8QZ64_9AGAM|nr:hypothetical protein AZE42_11083 [Rhizopogon vesiculosus]
MPPSRLLSMSIFAICDVNLVCEVEWNTSAFALGMAWFKNGAIQSTTRTVTQRKYSTRIELRLQNRRSICPPLQITSSDSTYQRLAYLRPSGQPFTLAKQQQISSLLML